MSWSQADIDALDDAIKRGVAEVTYPNGQRVRFPTMSDLLKARALGITELSKELAAASGKRAGYSLAEFQG